MITDAQTRLSGPAQAVAGTGILAGTNALDLLSANRNIGRGQPMRLVVTVDATFAGGTTLVPRFIQSANADMSASTTIATGPSVATPAAGTKIWDTALSDNTARYISIAYDRTGTYTAGAVSAHIVSDSDFNPYVTSVTGY